MTTENPFDGREYDGRVFRDRHERNFFIGRLSPRQREEWLRDHPERWQTREEFLRDLQARTGTDIEAEPPEACSTTSANEARTSCESDEPLPVPGEDKRPPDKSATNTVPRAIANPQASTPATAAAGDEIVIDDRQLLGERRVAETPLTELLKPDGCRAPPPSSRRAAGARHHQRLARASGEQ